MKTLTKALVGTATAVAMTAASASPAMARDRDRNEISAGDVIAGVAILGGVIAVASAIGDNDDDYGYQRGYPNDRRGDRYDDRYYGQGNSRAAVEQCINAARYEGRRYGNVQVQDVTRVERSRNGYTIKGRVVAETGYRGRDRGWGNGGYNDRYGRGGYDQGTFSCKVRYGQVSDIKFSGLRGYNNRGW